MRELAYYYPDPVWYRGDLIKNLILFFDGVALLVPRYMRDKPFQADPAIATGLKEHGLLEILEPEHFIDAASARAMADTILQIVDSGKLDKLTRDGSRFAELSYSRLGSFADERVAKELLRKLKRKGLARDSEDEVSIPMHPLVRRLVLVLWAQFLRPVGRAKGLELCPATDRPGIVASLSEFLSVPELPSAGHVVSADLQFVSIDLGPVPIDEVLGFRKEHGAEYRSYSRQLRAFVRGLGPLGPEERSAAIRDREQEIRDAAAELREVSRRAWRRPAARLALGIAGAAWTVASGELVPGAIALAGALMGSELGPRRKADAYSFLLSAHERYAG